MSWWRKTRSGVETQVAFFPSTDTSLILKKFLWWDFCERNTLNTCWNPTWPSTSTSSWLLTSTKLTGETKPLPPSARISSINWWSPAALREHIGSPCWYGTDVSVKHCFVKLPNKTFPSINLLLIGSCQRKPRRVLRCLKFLNYFQHKLVWQLTPCETWRLEDRDRLFFFAWLFCSQDCFFAAFPILALYAFLFIYGCLVMCSVRTTEMFTNKSAKNSSKGSTLRHGEFFCEVSKPSPPTG